MSGIRSKVTKITTNNYDVLGRIRSFESESGARQLASLSYAYDALGNRRGETNWLSGKTTNVRTVGPDHDRLCRVDYVSSTDTACDVLHDAAGNVTEMRTPHGTRSLSFYPSGLIRTLSETSTASTLPSSATFSYDATGEISEISEISSNADVAVDRRFGLILERSTSVETLLQLERITSLPMTSVLVRHIPGPGGVVATSAGKFGDWRYRFGEQRGNRFTTGDRGGFVQDVAYDAFGVSSSVSPSASTGDPSYMREQWNGGTALAGFDLVQLGARMYDPRLGRFLSRDPLVIPRSSATTNPYAFAANDPINLSDPTGLDFGICATSWGGACGSSPSTGDSSHVGTALGLAGLAYQLVSGSGGMSGTASPSFVPKQDTSAVDMWPTFRRGGGVLNYLGGVASGFGGAAMGAFNEARSFHRDLITGRLGLRAFEAAGGLVDAAMHPARTANAIRNGVVGRITAIAGGDPEAVGKLLFEVASVVAGGTLARAENALSAVIRGPNGRAVFGGFEIRGVRDLSHVSESTLREQAKKGFASKDHRGRKLALHHLDQNPAGPLVEMPAVNHSVHNRIQHPLGNTPGSGLTAAQRAEFNVWREQYWRARAQGELTRRGLQ